MTDRDKLIEDLTHEAWLRDTDATDLSDIRAGVMRTIAAIEANGLVVVPGWQPIESAPRDGTRVYAKGRDFGKPDGDEHFVWVVWELGEWLEADDENSTCWHLTHWMPLPAAPKGEG
jgi:hypothetical protein